MKLHSCRMLKIFWNHAKATQVLCFFQIPKRRAKKKKKEEGNGDKNKNNTSSNNNK